MKFLKKVETASEAVQKEYGVVYAVIDKVLIKGPKKPNIVLYYNDGTKQEYKYETAMTWNLISGKTGQWTSNTTLVKAELNEGVTSIDIVAFNECTSLTSVTIPNSVTIIGNNAFSNCKSLAAITLPNSVLSINAGAFNSCLSLTSVNIPNSVTSIGSNAFRYCSQLSSVIYKGTAYTSKSALTSALTNGGVTVNSNAFSNTALTA